MTHADVFEIYGVPRQVADHSHLNGLADDDHTQYAIISSGSGNPGSAPARVGAVYVDTTNKIVYLAVATGGSVDWKEAAALAMTTAQRDAISSPATGLETFNVDTYTLEAYDTQRWRALSNTGFQSIAYPLNFVASAAFTTAATLAANGGSIAIPIFVESHMLLRSVSVRNTDAATQRTWGWDLYVQYLNNGNSSENTLTRWAASNGDDTFTPVAASIRTLDAASAPVYLPPGLYWLVIQCTHATNNFGLGSTAASAAFAPNSGQTKLTTNPNSSTLDFVSATWTKVTAIYAVCLNGGVFGQSVAF